MTTVHPRLNLTDRYRVEDGSIYRSGCEGSPLAGYDLGLGRNRGLLPDVVRGYEGIKLRNVAAYRDQLAQLRSDDAEVLV